MKVLHLHPGDDTGGKSMAAKQALEAQGDSVRVFVGPRSTGAYFDYPAGQQWDQQAVEEAHDWADIIVLHNEPAKLKALLPAIGSKPLMVHHHGSILRRGGIAKWREGDELGAVQVVSTLDLLKGLPESVRWLPQIVDVSAMAAVREREYRPHHGVVVSHAPTSKQIKGTRFLLQATARAKGAWTRDIISRRPWAECLARKARSDIYFDQLELGYGANAIEAWGMGLPVIAGATSKVIARMTEEFGALPFYRSEPDRDRFAMDVRTLVNDPDLRAEWGARGRAHARRFHDVEPFVARFREYARQAMGVAVAA